MSSRPVRNAPLVAGAIVGVLIASALSYRQFVLLPAMREPLLKQLSAPQTAQFRLERYVGPWTVGGGALCGEINAKNRMGGYTGFTPYFSAGGEAVSGPETPRLCDTVSLERAAWWWLRW